ncbi:hypothetical protein LZ30DRAFT_600936 [Colletotrichum cereale]|nr:hypothetical protein LZ30DRAFT_600936 [Colletotrichum cereale]
MQGVQEAQELADAASKALRVNGSETSLAFYTWFGESNASPKMVKKLLDQHYMTTHTHLLPPTIPTRITFRKRLRFAVHAGDPYPGLNSLNYACPSASEYESRGSPLDICNTGSDVRAVGAVIIEHVTGENGQKRVGPTTLFVCPSFFDDKPVTNAEMVRSYRRNIDTEVFSKGFYLLHELQHMPKATSPDPFAIDVADPRDSRSACYSSRCCSILPNRLKISNAQNFAFFALDAVAFPQHAEPGSAPSS